MLIDAISHLQNIKTTFKSQRFTQQLQVQVISHILSRFNHLWTRYTLSKKKCFSHPKYLPVGLKFILFLTFQVTVRWFSPLLLGLMIRSPWSRVSIIFSAWLKLILWKLGWAITRFMYAEETKHKLKHKSFVTMNDVRVNNSFGSQINFKDKKRQFSD